MANVNTASSPKAKKILKTSMMNSIDGMDISSESSSLVSGFTKKLGSTYEDIKEGVSSATDSSVSFVKKYPLYTIAGIAAVGLAAGFYLKSRKNS
jgi:LPXTG-motif cell wall-anchored protein